MSTAKRGDIVLSVCLALSLVLALWIAVHRILQRSLQTAVQRTRRRQLASSVDVRELLDPETALTTKTAKWRALPANALRAKTAPAAGPTNSGKTVQFR